MSVLVTITGMSCGGKSTLEKLLQNQHGFKRLISHTTREKRVGEANGKDYHFVSVDDFISMVESGKMIENVGFSGKFYGLASSELESLDGAAVVVVDPDGLSQVAKWCKDNNQQHVAVYVGCDLPEAIYRMLLRYAAEDNHASIISRTYAQRMESLITVECDWYEMGEYDISITQYNGKNKHTEPANIEQFVRRMLVSEPVEEVAEPEVVTEESSEKMVVSRKAKFKRGKNRK